MNDVTDIEVGHAVSDGAGANVFVTNIIDNEVFFSGDLTTDKNGNNLSQNFENVTPVNFGQGTGARFDISRTGVHILRSSHQLHSSRKNTRFLFRNFWQ